MTNNFDLTELLGEPRLTIISTWDLVITPWLSLSMASTKAEVGPDDNAADLVHAVATGYHTAHAVGGLAALKSSFQHEEQRFIRCATYQPPYEQVYDGPDWLSRALEGFERYRTEFDPFVWEYMQMFSATDWEIAERTNEPLRMVKQVRSVKEALKRHGLRQPTSWSSALNLVANQAPEAFNPSLARTWNTTG